MYVKLQDLLHKIILGIGGHVHILSNAINTVSCAMPVDVEVIIITTIYLYFSRFIIHVASLKLFCEEANIEHKNLLGYSKVRWLALTPALEHVLHLFEHLRPYFNNEISEILMHFVLFQASIS